MQKEKEFINIQINKNKINDIIKLDKTDDLDGDNFDNPCGGNGMDEIKPKIKKVVNKVVCYKCKKNKSNYFNRNEFVCRECFLSSVNHKFRSNLRAHCKIRHEDYILVCISGNNNSMAMLNLFNLTFNDNKSNKKLFFKLKFLYVDDSCLEIGNTESHEEILIEREERISKLKEYCDKFKFDFDVINLETVLRIPKFNDLLSNNHYESYLINETQEKFSLNENKSEENFDLMREYKNLYNNISKIGSFNSDFNKTMIRNLIFYYAIKYGFTKIVFADSAQALVENIFGSIIKGRGFTLRENIGYIDNHYLNGRITILRPMRDFLEKEVLIFNYIYGIDLISSTSAKLDLQKINTRSNLPFGGNSSNLIHSFFNKQQERSSSIITTVLNTADKLKLKEESVVKSTDICEFCLNYIDEVYNELEIGSIDTMNNEKIFSLKTLCFGCKRMFQSLQDKDEVFQNLPKFYINF